MAAHVLLLRHGETEHSRSGRYSGRVDYRLSEHGRQQAAAWRSVLGDLAGVRVLTSPLSRARDTATLAGFPDAEIDDRLIEWDLGSLEGEHAAGVRERNPNWNIFRDGPPDGTGESVDRVTERAAGVLADLAAGTARPTLLVSHGQFLRVVASTALAFTSAATARLSYGPARLSILTERSGGLSLTGWNLGPTLSGATLLSELT
ncbi:histidine phosphatase family protein [Agromyces bauzanensis]